MGFEVTILDKRAEFLRGRAFNYTSQFGEDGLIEAAFEKIGVKNKWCFEVGAGDGIALSNTKILRDHGWSSVLIEADAERYQRLVENCRQSYQSLTAGQWHSTHETIGPDSLDHILAYWGAPDDLDLGVIDIDGQDYFVWEGMKRFQPRLMLVEFSPYGTPDDMPMLGGPGQAGLNPILALGRAKGYFPMAQTYVNVLFCREDQWSN